MTEKSKIRTLSTATQESEIKLMDLISRIVDECKSIIGIRALESIADLSGDADPSTINDFITLNLNVAVQVSVCLLFGCFQMIWKKNLNITPQEIFDWFFDDVKRGLEKELKKEQDSTQKQH